MQMRMVLTAAALILASACGGSYSSPSPATPSPTPTTTTNGTPVSITRGASLLTTTAFSPNPITVPVGGSLTWTNNDTTTHTVTATDGAWGSNAMAPGTTFTRTFSTAGSVPYHCTIHPGMVGTITVQ